MTPITHTHVNINIVHEDVLLESKTLGRLLKADLFPTSVWGLIHVSYRTTLWTKIQRTNISADNVLL